MVNESGLLRLVWEKLYNAGGAEAAGAGGARGDAGYPSGVLSSVRGEKIRIIDRGDPDPDRKVYSRASVEIDGVVHRGDVVFGPPAQIAQRELDYAVLHVVAQPVNYLMRFEGEPVPQVVMEIPECVAGAEESLRRGSAAKECAVWLETMPPLYRNKLYEDIYWERLLRKSGDILALYEQTGRNWEQVLYVMMFRVMGGNRNKVPYTTLGMKATYTMVVRERSSQEMVEALMFGTAGLLTQVMNDDRIEVLKKHFDGYLQHKYQIKPMLPRDWITARHREDNAPVLRIAQLAALVCQKEFLYDSVLNCRTFEDVRALFSAQASEYWSTHRNINEPCSAKTRSLGPGKADLFGINLVAPMLYTVGRNTGRESLTEAAINLINTIPAESNSIVNRWSGAGAPIKSALDSQAILQLSNEFCDGHRCAECRLGKEQIRRRWRRTEENFINNSTARGAV